MVLHPNRNEECNSGFPDRIYGVASLKYPRNLDELLVNLNLFSRSVRLPSIEAVRSVYPCRVSQRAYHDDDRAEMLKSGQ